MDSQSSKILNSDLKLRISDDLTVPFDFQLRGILSPKSKYLLTVPPEDRNDEDILYLLSELLDFRFFEKFPIEIRRELARKSVYTTKSAKTYVIEQGQMTEAMYVILSGVVTMKYKQEMETGEILHWPEKILKSGDYFGHEDLLHYRRSLIDIQCVGYTELLEIKRDDFCLIRDFLQAGSSPMKKHLRSSTILNKFDWTEEEYEVLEIFSELEDFVQDQEVYDGSSGAKTYWSYFVVSGEFKLVRKMEEEFDPKQNVPYGYHNPLVGARRKPLQLETIRQGFYFGVGENFSGFSIYATAAAECLKVPRLMLVYKDKKLLDKMAADLEVTLPDDTEIIDGYQEFKKETEDVEKMIKNMFERKPWRLSDVGKKDKKPPFVKYV